MTELDRVQIKKNIVAFASHGVQHFLQAHPDMNFYAFAFDCHAEYAEVNLCLNTEADFSKRLESYQERFSEVYQNEANIRDLKYNTGDWAYQCFDTISILSDEQLEEMFQAIPANDEQIWKTFVSDLLLLFTEALHDFTSTEVYKKIPKTTDFIAFCIDHDESVEDALNRMKDSNIQNQCN